MIILKLSSTKSIYPEQLAMNLYSVIPDVGPVIIDEPDWKAFFHQMFKVCQIFIWNQGFSCKSQTMLKYVMNSNLHGPRKGIDGELNPTKEVFETAKSC